MPEDDTTPTTPTTSPTSETPPVKDSTIEPDATNPPADALVETIKLDPDSAAFYRGVAAGATAADTVADLVKQSPDAGFQELWAYFWLSIGSQLQTNIPGASAQEQTLFLQGARMRAPEQPEPAFQLRVESFDSPGFAPTSTSTSPHSGTFAGSGAVGTDHNEDRDDERDDETCRQLIATLLRRAARDIADGFTGDDLHLKDPATGRNLAVGFYRVGELP